MPLNIGRSQKKAGFFFRPEIAIGCSGFLGKIGLNHPFPKERYAMLYYSFTLGQVALLLGLLYSAGGVLVFWRTGAAELFLTSFHRNRVAGWVLFGWVVVWTMGIMATVDLMEYTPLRNYFLIALAVISALVVRYLEDYLPVRALGMVLLLFGKVILDAAYLREDDLRLVMTVSAYVHVVVAMVMVGSPYLMRDAMAALFSHARYRVVFFGLVVAYGIVLVGLALFGYGLAG